MAGGTPVRVLVADDHPAYLEGLAAAVRADQDLALLASCANGVEALEAILRLRPDVAVLDMRMPGHTASDLLGQLERAGSATRVLVLSAYVEGPEVFDALEAGAAGYLAKEEPSDRICDAIRAIAAGEVALGAVAQLRIAEEIRTRRALTLLTEREREVLTMLAEGMSARDIAARLVLGTATVKTHLHHVYEKLGVTSGAAAVAEGMRRGVLR